MRRSVRESYGEDLIWPRPASGKQLRQAGRQYPSFARTRTSQHQNRPIQRFNCLALRFVQSVEPGGRRRGVRRGFFEGQRIAGERIGHRNVSSSYGRPIYK